MKIKHLISSLLLSASLVTAGALFASQEKVEKAEAATTFGAGTNIYLAGTGDITITGCTLSAWVHYTSGSHWETFSYDDLSGYYMITLDSNASALTFARTSNGSDGGTNWSDVGSVYNQTDMSFQSGKNWIWPKSWNNSITCEWRYIYYHVAGSFNNWTGNSSSYQMSDGFDDDGNHQSSFTLTTTKENEELKCTANYNGTVPGANWYGTLASGYNTEYIGTKDGNILLKKAATYEIYLKSDRTVWVQISSADEANAYALTFLSLITCTSDSVSFNINSWNKVGQATTSVEYKFEQLTTGAKNVLKGTIGNKDGSNVEQCIARYDRILSKYGYGTASGQYHDFMGRKPSLIAGRSLIAISSIANSSTIIVTVVIAGVAAIAAGGYFLLRKKKEN